MYSCIASESSANNNKTQDLANIVASVEQRSAEQLRSAQKRYVLVM